MWSPLKDQASRFSKRHASLVLLGDGCQHVAAPAALVLVVGIMSMPPKNSLECACIERCISFLLLAYGLLSEWEYALLKALCRR